MPKKVSIVIPAYNEEKRIQRTLKAIDKFFLKKNIPYEIIVVNDGSKDKTSLVVKNFSSAAVKLLEYPANQGKGYAIKQGVKEANGEYILFTDADNSTPIEEFDKLFHKMNETHTDLAIGSRYLDESLITRKQHKVRIFLSRIGNRLIQKLLLPGIIDTQCGFKLFRHAVAKKLFEEQKLPGWSFDIEIMVLAKKFHYHLIEVPVLWHNSEDSRLRPIRDSLKTLWDLMKIKRELRK